MSLHQQMKKLTHVHVGSSSVNLQDAERENSKGGAHARKTNFYSRDVFSGVNEFYQTFVFPIDPSCSDPSPLLCVIQKHVAALFVPGAPVVSRISVSARSVAARRSPPCVEVMAPPITTSVSSACPPACRRGGSTWWSPVAATKVGNGLWNGVIMLTNRPLKWCNYLYQLTCGSAFSHLCVFIMVQHQLATEQKMKWKSVCVLKQMPWREQKLPQGHYVQLSRTF